MDNNLHSLNKLKSEIKAAKFLAFLLPKGKRMEIKKLDKQLLEIENTIIQFNK